MRTWFTCLAVVSVSLFTVGCGNSTNQADKNPNGGLNPNVDHVFNGTCDMSAEPFGGGDGSSGSPYQICTVAQLNHVSDSDYTYSHFLLIDDLDLSNSTIEQVGNLAGIFNGNGKTLRNWVGIGPLFMNVSGTVKDLTIEEAQLTGSYRTGLVAGTVSTSGRIENCHASGTLSTSYMSGGLVGHNAGTITDSSSDVDIIGTDHLGGLAGANVGTITRCSASGQVVVTTTTSASGYAGGLVAQNSGGTISFSSANTAITGKYYSGGLVGYDQSGTISRSSAGGTINGLVATGGLIGLSYSSNISNCYSTVGVHGTNGVGGLIGANGSTVSSSYAAGAVSGTSNVGGLIGANSVAITPEGGGSPVTYNGAVSGSYWDTQVTGQGSSAAGTAANTAQMQNQATFVGWDFANIWNSPSGSYPTLK